MACALAPPRHLGCLGLIEEHHGFRSPGSVLGGSETQNIDTCFPGDVGRCAAKRDDGIGEPRPIHVQRQSARSNGGRERRNLIWRVDQPAFCCLRDRQALRLNLLDRAMRHAGQARRHRFGRQLAAISRHSDKFCSVREKLRRTTFVIRDVAFLMGQHSTPGPGHAGQRQRIGARACGQKRDDHVALEQRGHGVIDTAGPGIVAIGQRSAVIGSGDGRHDLGAGADGVVAGEI